MFFFKVQKIVHMVLIISILVNHVICDCSETCRENNNECNEACKEESNNDAFVLSCVIDCQAQKDKCDLECVI